MEKALYDGPTAGPDLGKGVDVEPLVLKRLAAILFTAASCMRGSCSVFHKLDAPSFTHFVHVQFYLFSFSCYL